MLGFFWRSKLFLYKVCPQWLVTPAPSLAECHQRTSHSLGATPSAPSLSLQPSSVTVVSQYGGAMQWVAVASALLCSLPATPGETFAPNSDKVSPRKLANLLEAAGCSSVQPCLAPYSLSHFSCVRPCPQAPGTHTAASDPFQKSSSRHIFSLRASQVQKQRCNILIAKISNRKFSFQMHYLGLFWASVSYQWRFFISRNKPKK